jgi:hypothetical protein
MQDVQCAACGAGFSFDPKTVWNSPGTIKGPQPGTPPNVLIQCPDCKQSVRVALTDEGGRPQDAACRPRQVDPRIHEPDAPGSFARAVRDAIPR